MSKAYSVEIPAHSSIYTNNYSDNNYKDRKIRVDYSEPEQINENTGVLLLIAGYGASIDSNVYIKMRKNFSDLYNLIVLQCNYFGSEFMQGPQDSEIERVITEIDNNKDMKSSANECYLNFNVNTCENIKNFNDMGIMQAIDNITAVLAIINMIKSKSMSINMKKIIIYGHSHGAYLSYMCNRFCPQLFQLIIENSAYIYPAYLNNTRKLFFEYNSNIFSFDFQYLISNIEESISKEIYSLEYLYRNFNNMCYIVSYHGELDDMTSFANKSEFVRDINKMVFIGITESDIDGEVIKSCSHGLDADFIKMFDITYKAFENKIDQDVDLLLANSIRVVLKDKMELLISYDAGFPIVKKLKY
ncbi:DUF2920 family protein [Anaerocolumna sp.]|uniref:DUF2920 family protein n=1 Tax=Anaerocolumna sp. TaxID=2041569 RepID=UPI0028AA923F|nr:DUF2920 family protein [Anaerocolumna sp.]